MIITGLDPGTYQGWAHIDGDTGLLLRCGLGMPSFDFSHNIVIEKPVIYPRSKGDPNDLITLAIKVGRLLNHYDKPFTSVVLVEPRTWKGSVPKDIHNARVLNALSKGELATLEENTYGIAKSKLNNVIDAIGIAKWAFKSKAFG